MSRENALTFVVFGLPRPAGSKRAFALKKNGVFTGRTVVTDDCKDSREWKNNVRREAAINMDGMPMFLGPVILTAVFYMPRPKGHYRTGKRAAELRPAAPRHITTKPDLLKLTRAVEDAMTGIVWRDDAQVVEHRLFKKYGQPGCVVQVTNA